ncbi:MAG: ATPase, T2SS/T4P/T4SS family [Methylotetracoccus sp.]
MTEPFDLARLLDEVVEDEKVTTNKNRRVSQGEIKRLIAERRQQAQAAPREADAARIGELLLRHAMISPEQLREALAVQSDRGGRLGSLLVELGFVSAAKLVELLGKQHNVPGADLFQIASQRTPLSILPRPVMLKHRVLPLGTENSTVRLAMERPDDFAAIHEVEFLTGKRVHPVIAASYQIDLALRCIDEHGGTDFAHIDLQSIAQTPVTIDELLTHLVTTEAADLYLAAGSAPCLQSATGLRTTDFPKLSADHCAAYAKTLMSEAQWEQLLERKDISFALQSAHLGRFRVTAHRQRNAVSLAIRRIPGAIPDLATLGLPADLGAAALAGDGIILIGSPPGHGRSTTAAALVQHLNRSRAARIVTLEDPIEHLHDSVLSIISQRELGDHVDSVDDALRMLDRQGCDTLLIDVPSASNAIARAIEVAGSGRLIIATLVASNPAQTVESIVAAAPPSQRELVRSWLADRLRLVFVQQLMTAAESGGRVIRWETLDGGDSLRSLLVRGDWEQIRRVAGRRG